MHRRHASPSLRERNSHTSFASQTSAPSNIPGYGTSAIVAMDRSASLPSGTSLSSGLLLSQAKSVGKPTERSLESVLHASKQKVTAIESMLRGLDISEKSRSSSLDLGVEPPSSRDPPFPLAVPASNALTNSLVVDTMSGISKAHSSYSTKRASEKLQDRGLIEGNADVREARRYMNSHVDRQYFDTPYKDANYRDSQNGIPNFQRPLLRKNAAGRMSAGRRRSFDDSQFSLGDVSSYADVPASLNDALSEGLNSSSDWSARVAAFNYVRSMLQQGPRGYSRNYAEFREDLIPACRKPFESYMERILPHVFSRLIDPKELVRQPCSTTLDIVSKTYGTDSLLPALLRSLDEQRSPKAKLAVIEFAIGSFNKHASNSEGCANSGILKLWLAKLTPMVHDKNTKLKEAAITCIISVYTHFDSIAVLNFILSLSVEEQNLLRRALKQYTPRIEVDLMNFLQNKRERRGKSSYDPSDVVGTSSEEGYIGASKKSQLFGRYSAGSVESDGGRKWTSLTGSVDSDGGRKWSSLKDASHITGSVGHLKSDEAQEHLNHKLETSSNPDIRMSDSKNLKYASNTVTDKIGCWASGLESMDSPASAEVSSTPHLDVDEFVGSDHQQTIADFGVENELSSELAFNHSKLSDLNINSEPEEGLSIPQILHLICNGNGESPAANKRGALQQLVDASVSNDQSIWSKYFNQILTAVLEVLDDFDSSIRELTLSLIVEMLKNQKDAMEDSVEIVIEKLLHVTKDGVPKVTGIAEHCLTIVLSQYDQFRCLSVIVPLLVTEDERTLVTCINCLTKLVGRLSREELMGQLPSFLPALFDAFGNQSADVRKTVVFCLVDIYIMLGKGFLPYLEGLNCTQLRLVTIYANRISQARTGAPIDGTE
ncbi:CLIP-associated protein [Abeliophyllum distichum]|uniref:CLIP-associated protein n=1 Tax=Abeliophyllum distichum TaxID=126358 RepID=A0ABD1TE24_9LAMI